MNSTDFILILLVLNQISAQIASKYRVRKGFEVNANLNNSFLIENLRIKDKTRCIIECNQRIDCLTITFSASLWNNTINCLLYAKYFNKNDIKASIAFDILEKDCVLVKTLGDEICIKQDKNITRAIYSYRQRFRINNGSGIFISNPDSIGTYYYGNEIFYYIVATVANTIHIFNEKWEFVTYKSMSRIYNIIQVDNQLILSSDYAVYQTDKYLNVNKTLNIGSYNRGMIYNKTNERIYVTDFINRQIHVVYSRNFTYLFSYTQLSLYNIAPAAIDFINDIMYLGTESGRLGAMNTNGTLVLDASFCGTTWLTCLLIDDYNMIGGVCLNDYKVNIAYPNSTLTGISKTTTSMASYMIFDFHYRFLLLTKSGLDIYY